MILHKAKDYNEAQLRACTGAMDSMSPPLGACTGAISTKRPQCAPAHGRGFQHGPGAPIHRGHDIKEAPV